MLWGTLLVILLLGGGLYFAVYCRMVPILYFKHSIEILLGKYDSKDDPGQITHFEALSSALAGTVGMGNIAGVAVAIHTGGPGAVFDVDYCYFRNEYKIFTCTLSVLYRGYDDKGEIQGGVMYYIEKGLGENLNHLVSCLVFLVFLVHLFSFRPINFLKSFVILFTIHLIFFRPILIWVILLLAFL